MTEGDTRIIGYGVAGSLVTHLLLFCALALFMNMGPAHKIIRSIPKPEPVVTMVFPQDITVTPPPEIPQPKTEAQRYIRTTQNEDAGAAPTKADFVSDRNTNASAKLAPDPAAVTPLPTLKGVSVPTLELANREYKDGQIKDDSALSPPTPPKPESSPPEPQPQKMAHKDDAQIEKMMKELDTKLLTEGAEHLPLEARRVGEPPEVRPEMKTPDELPVPKAVPMPPVLPPPPPATHGVNDSFVPQTRTSAAKGTLSNRGDKDAVNAAATPTGRYTRQVTSAIEKKWNQHRLRKADFVEPGKLRLHFYVDRDGKISPGDLRIVFNEANAVLTDFTLSSILEAEIPPIPQELIPKLDRGRFEIEYDVVVY